MARVVIVSSEPLGGSIGGGITTFVHHFGSLLLERGDELTWIVADPTDMIPHGPPVTPLARAGARMMHVRAGPGPAPAFVRASAAVADALPEADVVYLQDWGALGLVPVRSRRLRGIPDCPIVTVLHSTTDWIRSARQVYPASFSDDTALSFAERYVAEHSDITLPASDAMRRWLLARGWRIDGDHVDVLGLPFVPHAPVDAVQPAASFRRVVFFGRLQTIKGLELFVEAVERLAEGGGLAEVEEIVFLGAESENRIGTAATVVRRIRAAGMQARALCDLDSVAARSFLTEHRTDSLVVVPSLVENFPYTVIEASGIPGLNLLCSNVGGIPEILRDAPAQLFDPHVEPLMVALRDRLAAGPLSPEHLSRYDAESANHRWLKLHESVLANSARNVVRRKTRWPSIDVYVDGSDGEALTATLASVEGLAGPLSSLTVVLRGEASNALRTRIDQNGWRLVGGEASAGATRNAAASSSQAEYLLFIPAGAIARPHLLATLRDAVARSGTDAVVSAPSPADGGIGALPVGGGLATAIVGTPFRATTPLVRRDAFEAIGGFAEEAWLANIDEHLLTRLAAAGYDIDVVPVVLVERWPAPRVNDEFRERDRILDVFRRLLAPLSLTELPEVIFGAADGATKPDTSVGRDLEPSHPSQPGRPLARLGSQEGWETAERVARTTSWRAVVGALLLKVARRARRLYVAVRSK